MDAGHVAKVESGQRGQLLLVLAGANSGCLVTRDGLEASQGERGQDLVCEKPRAGVMDSSGSTFTFRRLVGESLLLSESLTVAK